MPYLIVPYALGEYDSPVNSNIIYDLICSNELLDESNVVIIYLQFEEVGHRWLGQRLLLGLFFVILVVAKF